MSFICMFRAKKSGLCFRSGIYENIEFVKYSKTPVKGHGVFGLHEKSEKDIAENVKTENGHLPRIDILRHRQPEIS